MTFHYTNKVETPNITVYTTSDGADSLRKTHVAMRICVIRGGTISFPTPEGMKGLIKCENWWV